MVQQQLLERQDQHSDNTVSLLLSGSMAQLKETSVFSKLEMVFRSLAASSQNFVGIETQRRKNSDKVVEDIMALFNASSAPYIRTLRSWAGNPASPNHQLGLYMIESFKKSLAFKNAVFKGSSILLNRSHHLVLKCSDPKVFEFAASNYVVSNVVGDYILVKNKDMKTVARVWLHSHQFKKADNMPITRLVENASYNHSFKEGILLPALNVKPYDVLWHVKNSLPYHCVSVNYVGKKVNVIPMADENDFSRFRREASFEKPIADFRLVKDHTVTQDANGFEIRIGDHAILIEENIHQIMNDAGWPITSNTNSSDILAWNDWAVRLKKLICVVKDIVDNGKHLIVNFEDSDDLQEHFDFIGFDFIIKSENLMYVDPSIADEMLLGTVGINSTVNKKKHSNTARRPNEYEQKQARLEKEKQDAIEFDRVNGPYPDLSVYVEKVVRFKHGFSEDFDGKYCYITSVDQLLGRLNGYCYSGKSKENWFFRSSQKVLDFIDIIGDKIYAD